MSAERAAADGVTFEDALRADEETLRARGFASAFCAAWLVFWEWAEREFGPAVVAELQFRAAARRAQPESLATFFDKLRRAYMAVMAAAVRDYSRSTVRRFRCPAWVLEGYRQGRELIPDDLAEADRLRLQRNFSRYWRRDGRAYIHTFQLVSHLSLVTWDGRCFADNTKAAEAASYTERLCDLIADVTAIRQRNRRKGVAGVVQFRAAVTEAVASFRKQFAPYAPEWTPGTDGNEASGEGPTPDPKLRAKAISFGKVERKIGEAVELLKARAAAGQLTPEEADRVVMLLAPVVEITRSVSADRPGDLSANATPEEAAEVSQKTIRPAVAISQNSAKNNALRSGETDRICPFERPASEVTLDDFLAAFFPDPEESIWLRFFAPKGVPVDAKRIPLDPRFSPRKLAVTRATFGEGFKLMAEARWLNQTRGAYFVVNSGGNRADEIVRFNGCFAEADDLSIAEQHARLDACPLQPSARLETAKSVHGHWLLRTGATVAEWRRVQAGLIAYFGSDPKIKDPSRVMRLPFFNHVAYRDGLLTFKPVRLVAFEPSRRYSIADVLAAFPAPEEKPRAVRRPATLAKLSGDFEQFKRELGARIGEHPSARRNSRGKVDCRAVCHDGKGSTGLFYDPADNFVWCNAPTPCDLTRIAAAFGLTFDAKPARRTASAAGREVGVI